MQTKGVPFPPTTRARSQTASLLNHRYDPRLCLDRSLTGVTVRLRLHVPPAHFARGCIGWLAGLMAGLLAD